MADPHVLTGLIAKRAEIAGQIEHTQDQLRQLVIDLDHIERAAGLEGALPYGGAVADFQASTCNERVSPWSRTKLNDLPLSIEAAWFCETAQICAVNGLPSLRLAILSATMARWLVSRCQRRRFLEMT